MIKKISIVLMLSFLVATQSFRILDCVGAEKAYGADNTRNISVFVCGQKVDFADQSPEIINNRVMVPLRAVFEHPNVQAEVNWDESERMVTATDRTSRIIVFRIGKNTYHVRSNGNTMAKSSDVAPLIKNGRTLLPLRALAESLNFEVNWLDAESKVEIKEKAGNTSQDRKLISREQWQLFLEGKISLCTPGG